MTMADESDVFGDVLAKDVAVRNYLRPLKKHLQESGATELWINKPGQFITEVGPNKVYHDAPELTFAALEAFSVAVAVFAHQPDFGPKSPVLSASLPDGERIQIVRPPAVEPGTIAICIRVPNAATLSFDDYEADGAFDKFVWPHPADTEAALRRLLPEDRQLAQTLLTRNLKQFLLDAIGMKKNIGVVGDTGSGKTTLMKAMCQYIDPEERLITVEDVRELFLPNHANTVHLLFSRGGQDGSKITSSDLIGSVMRMTPSRCLPAELRGLEAWDFLKLLTSGHAGAITSWHAENCELAFERFMFMAKENPQAAGLSRDELKHLVRLTVDIVIHVKRELVYEPGDANGARKAIGVRRYVDEVFFDPWAKNLARFGQNGADLSAALPPVTEEA